MNGRGVQHDKPALELKAATRALIRAAGGTDGAAQTVGARQQRMSDCQNRIAADFLRLDEVAALEDVAPDVDGWPPVTRALARRQGFALVRLPTETPTAVDWNAEIGALAKKSGETIEGICASLSDAVTPGLVTAQEVAEHHLIERIDGTIERLVALREMARVAP